MNTKDVAQDVLNIEMWLINNNEISQEIEECFESIDSQ